MALTRVGRQHSDVFFLLVYDSCILEVVIQHGVGTEVMILECELSRAKRPLELSTTHWPESRCIAKVFANSRWRWRSTSTLFNIFKSH